MTDTTDIPRDADAADAALSLVENGVGLADDGDLDGAVDSLRKAVAVYRAILGEGAPTGTDCRGDFGVALSTLGSLLDDADSPQEALTTILEAIVVLEGLDDDERDEYAPDLADAEINVSILRHRVGDYTEAIETAERAAARYRALVGDEPDEGSLDLVVSYARSIGNLGVMLRHGGRMDEAVALHEEAVAIGRRHADDDPPDTAEELAEHLGNLAVTLFDAGRAQEGLANATEAIAMLRELSEDDPEPRARLAGELVNHARMLSGAGLLDPAIEASVEAIAILRDENDATDGAHDDALALALSNYAGDLSEAERTDEALAVLREAVQIRRDLVADGDDASGLAQSLNNLSIVLSGLDEDAEALAAATEAVEIMSPLGHAHPSVHGDDLALMLDNLAYRLADVDRDDEAAASATRAIDVYETVSPGEHDDDVERLRDLLSSLKD